MSGGGIFLALTYIPWAQDCNIAVTFRICGVWYAAPHHGRTAYPSFTVTHVNIVTDGRPGAARSLMILIFADTK
jgi:hypothetical protein